MDQLSASDTHFAKNAEGSRLFTRDDSQVYNKHKRENYSIDLQKMPTNKLCFDGFLRETINIHGKLLFVIITSQYYIEISLVAFVYFFLRLLTHKFLCNVVK